MEPEDDEAYLSMSILIDRSFIQRERHIDFWKECLRNGLSKRLAPRTELHVVFEVMEAALTRPTAACDQVDLAKLVGFPDKKLSRWVDGLVKRDNITPDQAAQRILFNRTINDVLGPLRVF